MIFQKQYPSDEAFYLALKAEKDAAFSYLWFKLERPVAKLCHQYHLATPDEKAIDIVQDVCEDVLVNLRKGTYTFDAAKPASPVTYALSIARNKVATEQRKQAKSKEQELDDFEADIVDDESITDWENVDLIKKHLYSKMCGVCARLIWLRSAERKPYQTIMDEQSMPEFTHIVGLRKKYGICWAKWMELLKRDGLK